MHASSYLLCPVSIAFVSPGNGTLFRSIDGSRTTSLFLHGMFASQ
jgi:hypothetical protein